MGAFIATALVSCGEKEVSLPSTPVDSLAAITEKETQIRDEAISDLLSIKSEVRKAIDENINLESVKGFITDLESFRPRLEYIHMRTANLPEKEQMVIRGNLAVITKQLEKDLLAILAKAPGNDDLAVEISHLREQLSPIPLSSMLHMTTN